ncbi:hypothetical protein [Hydrogeniiclostridium mannosilyticum]|uniref:hypothetical protein n=1 Tax=Hydrogeniiclostridium mannosilyticum TaxID=2764322 RepID=UPI0018AC6802|nr:hypothetical protein [Hydrogeniiclostridium mannosilyticum]
MKKHTRVLSCLLSAALLLAMSACAAAPVQAPAPEGYSFIESPASDSQIVGKAGASAPMYITTCADDLFKMVPIVVQGEFLGNTDTRFSNDGTKSVYTKGLFRIEKVFKGDYEDPYIEALYPGGYFPLDKYIEEIGGYLAQHGGYDQIPENERAGKFIDGTSEFSASPEPGNSYILFLKPSLKEYWVQTAKFGILHVQGNQAYDYDTQSYKTFAFMQ